MQTKQVGNNNNLVIGVTIKTQLVCYAYCTGLGDLAVAAIADDAVTAMADDIVKPLRRTGKG
jgi:hypothetical protein